MTRIYITDILNNYNLENFIGQLKNKINIDINYKHKQTVVAWYLLLKLLEERLDEKDILFDKNIYGKPFLINNQYFFNISHSHKKVAVGISDREIGIDIEKILTPNLKISDKFFNKQERDFIFSDNDQLLIKKRFYIIWTLKESYLKHKGLGLKGGLNSFIVEIIKPDKINLISDSNLSFKLKYKETDDYILAYCGQDDCFEVIKEDI